MSTLNLLHVTSSSALPEAPFSGSIVVCSGYDYYHYICDGTDDRGWGCGYRTLQTQCSWIIRRLSLIGTSDHMQPVPSIHAIQQTLVAMGDKEKNFVGSRDWIGSVEVGLVLDKLYAVPCKVLHIRQGSLLTEYVDVIYDHLRRHQCPLMMGGESDVSSKAIVGISKSSHVTYLLILDPHLYDSHRSCALTDIDEVKQRGYLEWKAVSSFHQDTFYNLCMPLTQHILT